jgi:16S rRNA (cytosine1402-N4)-methyltransferase
VGEGSTDTPQGVGHGGKEVGHVPVLLKEAIDFLNVRRGGTYIDATVGLGGHSFEIAKRLGAPGHLIGSIRIPKRWRLRRSKLRPMPAPGGKRLAEASSCCTIICKFGRGPKQR